MGEGKCEKRRRWEKGDVRSGEGLRRGLSGEEKVGEGRCKGRRRWEKGSVRREERRKN